MPKFHQDSSRENPPAQPERSERLAISLFDLDHLDPSVKRRATKDKLDPVVVYPFGKDEPQSAAVAFSCPLLEAALIVDILWNHCRRLGQNALRVWLLPRPGAEWKLLRDDMILTLDGDHLNPEVFRPVVRLDAAPLPIRKMV